MLEKYVNNYKREIKKELDEKLKIISEWKEKLSYSDKERNFYHEKKKYPYFQEKFLKGLLDLKFEEDWVFEDSKFTLKGVVEFTIKGENGEPILLIELKGQNVDLDKPQHNYENKTPVQQAYNYALNSEANWYIVFNYDELRIYYKFDSYLKEHYISFKFSEIDENELIILILLLSKKFFKQLKILDEIKNETLVIEEEITDKIYKLYHETRLILIRQLQDNNNFDFPKALKYAQLIMNRIMFICFAEDRALIPNQILEKTLSKPINERVVKINRYSIWQELNLLFEDINEGHKSRNISEYNGGLFEEDLSFLKIPDLFEDIEKFIDLKQNHKIKNESIDRIVRAYCNASIGFINPIYYNILLLASFDYNTEINVKIMGHIFEQSITDLDELQQGIDIKNKAKKSRNKRKIEGIFYTPEYITNYICRNTIIPFLSKNNVNSPEKLVDEYNNDELNELEKKLKNLKILDMACGSGAFLNKAADVLLEIHKLIYLRKRYNNKIVINDKKDSIKYHLIEKYFDSIEQRKRIILNNLYGIDINSESVEITKLSLFLQIASTREKLPDLTHNIKHGNSLIDNEDKEIDDIKAVELKAFNWSQEFKEIIKDGGFDIIIGNPPYIRREKIEDEIKPILEKKYKIFHGNADLYCYFFERAISLLKPEGVLGFITSNKWMKTDYGRKLRFFLNSFFIQEIINFFELRVFKDASTEPAIIILKKDRKKNTRIKITLMETLKFEDLNQYVKNNHFLFNQNELNRESVDQPTLNEINKSMGIWNFTNPIAKKILNKIKRYPPLEEFLGKDKIKMGIKPERTRIFRINKEMRDKLIQKNRNSIEIIKPLLIGTDIERYIYNFQDFYLILTKNGIEIDKYPAIKEYLLEYKEDLEKRDSVKKKTSKWYELRPCDYYDLFEDDKIVYIHTAKKHKFALDTKGHYLLNNCYIIKSSDKYLLAYLNSKLFEFYKKHSFVAFGDARTSGRCKLDYNKMKTIPIKKISSEEKKKIIKLVNDVINTKEEFYSIIKNFLQFIKIDLEIEKIPKKLKNFYKLEPSDFLNEIKKIKKDIRIRQRKEIIELLNETKLELTPLMQEIKKKELAINNIIFNIYEINEKERKFIEKFLKE
ncbi:MAG: Eco57I restriction-modification methylase domain-containing protein [Promethearchaeota archaeon]